MTTGFHPVKGPVMCRIAAADPFTVNGTLP